MKRMLFNATQQEELRVAIVDGQKLIDIDIESTARELHKSNIYKAVITRIEPSLEACFVNYGEERHGFLPFKEVARSLFKEGVDVRNATIKDSLSEGQEIMVQVEKEERGNKGAALTTFISLAGRYLVLMPNNPRGGGVSRRVEGEERQELRETMDKLDVPAGMSIIARTAGIGRTVEELQWDLNYLLQLWKAIETASSSAPGAFLIYHESSLVIRAIRDYFQPDIGEILIDTDEIYEQARQFMSYVMPDMANRVKRYRDGVPLFSRFQIEHQIESAYSRVVSLPSGGSIVIDHTEALVAIDVNSARSTRGADIETTAFTTNCEAAEEVARQLRLRDLGGLIVIDFIDMESPKNRREIEARLKEALHFDRARVQMDKITRFGLMELSRQRLRPSLSEGSHITCPRCNGTGHIRDTESSALQVLRIIEEESMKESSAAIHVQIPVDVSAFLLNEKRGEIMKVESRHKVRVVLIPNMYLETPHYKLERIKHDDPRLEEPQASYKLAEQSDEIDMSFAKRQKEPVKPPQEAMVKNIPEGLPAPVVKTTPAPAEPEKGFFDRLLEFFGIGKTEAPKETTEKQPVREERKPRSGERRGRGRRGEPREERSKSGQTVTAAASTEQDDSSAPTTKNTRQRRARGEKADRQPREERKSVRNEVNAVKVDTPDAVTRTSSTALVSVSEAVQIVSDETDAVAMEASVQDRIVGNEDENPRRRRRVGRGRRREMNVEVSSEQRGTEPLIADSEGNVAVLEEQISALSLAEETEMPTENRQVNEMEAVQVSQTEGQTVSPRRENRRSHPRRRRSLAETATPIAETNDNSAIQVGSESPVSNNDAPPSETVATANTPVMEMPATNVIEVGESSPSEVKADAPVHDTGDKVTTGNVAETDTQEVNANEPVTLISSDVAETKKTDTVSPVSVPAHDPVSDLEEVLAKAGLVIAATDPEKMKKFEESQEQTETKQVKRVLRRKRAPVVIDEGPLIQVVTRKE